MPDDAVTEDREPIETPLPRAPGSASAPRVRTLLVCDLVDSTALVERLGDIDASDLMRRHDRLARDLLQLHNGREIDKTDGFLALFERPIEAVAFALAYQRALRTLGEKEKQTLRARVGVHVGEVVVWENSALDIAGGAKRLDVEGLAKPVVSRLMALALPGQIILSGIAFSLAQRAERELEAPATVRWLTHGRYRFKGVAAPMLVHEVGEVGVAPLQAPPSGAKAQKEVPLWRKPGVIALEAIAVLIAIAVPVVLSLRAPPAIAFGERDWIVMGELRNLTGETLLDDSLETAFRISLEQSRYVNVLSDLKLRDTLARMQKPADTAIDRNVASEIALREGARAVILPTVAEIGGRVRVSAEVIDPHTQTTVYAESADGVGAGSALASIDSVTHTLRAKLGEALAAIENDSAPLPKVTSGNIEALRAYALAEHAYAEGKLDEALDLYLEALRQDSGFALAMTGLARIDYRNDDFGSALRNAERALALSDRLAPRDRLYVDAWVATYGEPESAVGKWALLTRLYPDHHNGIYNLALYQWTLTGRSDQCVENARRIDVPQYPYRPDAVYLEGTCLLAINRIDDALQAFGRAVKLGVVDSTTLHAGAWAAKRNFAAATKLLDQEDHAMNSAIRVERGITAAAFLVDRGEFKGSLDRLRTIELPEGASQLRRNVSAVIAVTATIDGMDAAESDLLAAAWREEALSLDQVPHHERRYVRFAALVLGLAALRANDVEMPERVLAVVPESPQIEGDPILSAMRAVLAAEFVARTEGAEQGLAILDAQPGPVRLLQQQAARVRILAMTDRARETAHEAETLSQMSGQAYGEWGARNLLRTMNVTEVDQSLVIAAEAHAALGDSDRAQTSLQHFEARWPRATWPPQIKRRVTALNRDEPL